MKIPGLAEEVTHASQEHCQLQGNEETEAKERCRIGSSSFKRKEVQGAKSQERGSSHAVPPIRTADVASRRRRGRSVIPRVRKSAQSDRVGVVLRM